MKLSVVIILLVLFSALSCKDDKPKPYCEENPGECQSVLEAKKFFAFKVGTWWVYEEETSGVRDSMYVTQGINDYSSYDFDTRFTSALTDYQYHYFPFFAGGSQSCSESAPIKGKCLYVKRSKGEVGNFIGEENCFFIKYKIGDYTAAYNYQYPNNLIIIENVFLNYSLGSYNFNKTIKVKELNTMIENYQPTNHFFSENIGLIRKELLDSNEVWNLVNYHIEQ